jgi:hypothetical protein
LNLDFVKDFWVFFSWDDVVVLGGNDNGGDRHLDEDFGELQCIGLFKDVRYDIWVCREFWGWSMFNCITGIRLHLGSVVAGVLDVDLGNRCYGKLEGEWDVDGNMRVFGLKLEGYLDKSIMFELVDVKIIDFCLFGCLYCY